MEPIVNGQEWIVSAFNVIRDEYQRERNKRLKEPNKPISDDFNLSVKKALRLFEAGELDSFPGVQHLEYEDTRDFCLFLLGALFACGVCETGTKITLKRNPDDLI